MNSAGADSFKRQGVLTHLNLTISPSRKKSRPQSFKARSSNENKMNSEVIELNGSSEKK